MDHMEQTKQPTKQQAGGGTVIEDTQGSQCWGQDKKQETLRATSPDSATNCHVKPKPSAGKS